MEQAEKKVTVLNYNLYCLPWLAVMFKPSTCPYPAERAHHFITTHMASYDILCLQEVWNPHYSILAKAAKNKGYHVAGSSNASINRLLQFRVFGGGLMIISRYPILETKERLYDRGTGSDGFVSKGCVYAKIDLGSSHIHVFNTHLQASYNCEFKDRDPYKGIRTKQIKKIAKFISDITSEDDAPILLQGDFNVNARRAVDDDSDSAEYKEMIDILSGDTFVVNDLLREQNSGTHPITHEGSGVHNDKTSHGGQRLDFILEIKRKSTSRSRILHKFTDNVVVPFIVKDKIFTQVSDHWGVATTMHLYKDTCPDFVVEKDGCDEKAYKLSHASIQLSFDEE